MLIEILQQTIKRSGDWRRLRPDRPRLTTVFGILGIAHFAHGSISMFGGYLTFFLVTAKGLPVLAAIPVALVAGILLGLLVEMLAYRPVRNANHINAFIVALGLTMMVEGLNLQFFGHEQVVIPTGLSRVFRLGGITIPELRLYVIIAAILLVVAMMVFVERTKTGQAIRAVAENRDAAILMGVKCENDPADRVRHVDRPRRGGRHHGGGAVRDCPGHRRGAGRQGLCRADPWRAWLLSGRYPRGNRSGHHGIHRSRLHLLCLQGCHRLRGDDPRAAHPPAGPAGACAMNRTLPLLLWLLALIGLAMLPQLLTVKYYLHLSVLALIWVIVAQGQNLIQGFTGYVSIVQAGFMGIGAYASTLIGLNFQWPLWVTMTLAPLVTALFALATGYPSLRVKGHYFAIVTLAFNLIIVIVLVNYSELTKGEAGISNIPKPWRGDREAFFYLALTLAALLTLLAALIARSRVGEILLAIRQNEDLVAAVGIAAWKYKLFAFVISAMYAAWAARFMRISRASSTRKSSASRNRSMRSSR